MTPEEWADEVLDVTDGDYTRFPTVADVIRAAIAAEREACAKVAETLEAGNGRLREAAELTGYINGLTWAGNLKSRYHINDDTGKVINDLRQQIDNEITALDGGK